ncbi:rRNA small subunit methyltransferase B [Georgenia wutianyii]|uniref:rRNA small subunit methyltransferase B n=1 Tax=Georgenia wutianyii TaxID=2585135 RepID=A0ABX5VL37_9MICO|nr:transcription antitermination factor NusB [Georgenia wutianyii]QDB79186.1 rRNA small subunit methyltransferase B [Georgenia wutianyii]
MSEQGRRGQRPDHGRSGGGRSAAPRAGGNGPRAGGRPPQRRGRRGGEVDPVRTAAADTLEAVATSDAYANLVLPKLLRERGISGRDAAFATELVYGTLRLRGRYDAILARCTNDRPLDQVDPPVLDLLRLGAHQLLGMRVPAHAAVSETVALVRSRVSLGAGGFANAVLRAVSAADLETWLDRLSSEIHDDGARLAAVESHPAWVVRALRSSLRAHGRPATELPELLHADNEPPAVTLVARPGLVSPEEVVAQVDRSLAEDATPGRWAPTALRLPGGDPAALPAVREARAGVQDEGSQLVALALAAAPVEGQEARWLDLCAGPGGKSALLGAIAAERGVHLVANEVAPHRARLVAQSTAALPRESVEVRTGDGRTLGEAEPGAYDRVLVDAPCTGLGALRRRPESRWRRLPEDLPGLTALQRDLLESALAAVRPGGVVAYVTCSPHLAETSAVVADVLRGRDDVTRLDAREALLAATGRDVPGLGDGPDVQLWPHVHGTDAMFLALLRRER